MIKQLRTLIALDYRSLALLRIGMGATLFADVLQRLQDLNAHYTDFGLLPRSELLNLWGGEWNISLHTAFGAWPYELALFGIALIAAALMIVGFYTKTATVISWLLLISVHNRNPLVLQGGDVIFRVVLLWCIFLPLGSYFSLDRRLHPDRLPQRTYWGTATLAYFLQIVLFYFFAGFTKTGDAWIHDGTAVYYALAIDQMTTDFGKLLFSFPTLMKYLTFLTVYLEIGGALLLLLPFYLGPLRTGIIILFTLLQIGFNLSFHLGLFGMISIVVTLGLLPSWFWDHLYYRAKRVVLR